MPQDAGDIFDHVIPFITEPFEISEWIAAAFGLAGKVIGDGARGEFRFLDAEENSKGKDRINKPMGVADTEEAAAGVVRYPV